MCVHEGKVTLLSWCGCLSLAHTNCDTIESLRKCVASPDWKNKTKQTHTKFLNSNHILKLLSAYFYSKEPFNHETSFLLFLGCHQLGNSLCTMCTNCTTNMFITQHSTWGLSMLSVQADTLMWWFKKNPFIYFFFVLFCNYIHHTASQTGVKYLVSTCRYLDVTFFSLVVLSCKYIHRTVFHTEVQYAISTCQKPLMFWFGFFGSIFFFWI